MSVAQILNSIGNHPAYGLSAAGGLMLGGFYGLDGWRGSLKEVDLKNSPRVKNFLWLMGGGATAFVADISWDRDASKSILLLFYIACTFFGILVIVSFFACLTMLSAPHNSSAYGIGDALGDYLQFGYQYFRKQKDEKARESQALQVEQHRLLNYLKQLTNSITTAGARGSLSDRRERGRELLRTANEVVISRQSSPAVIRTNFMRVVACTAEVRPTIKFADDAAKISDCLELELYDSGVEPKDFRLPLLSAPILPGAPLALSRSQPVIIDDTNKIDYPADIPPSVRKSSKAYFEAQPFRSFASLPVVVHGRGIGVVNVESSNIEVFGSTLAEKELLAVHLLPFCAALGILLVD